MADAADFHILDAEHHHVEIPQPQGVQGVVVQNVGLHRVGDVVGQIRYLIGVFVHPHHFHAHVGQGAGHAGAEPAEP